MVISAVDRLAAEVLESVVHPTHVPLVTETEPARFDGGGDPTPCGGLFGNDLNARMLFVQRTVEFLQKAHRSKVLISSMFVGDPFPLCA